MDKYTVDLDKVLNDFEYSELTDQHTGSKYSNAASNVQHVPTQITNVFPSTSSPRLKNTNTTKHSITNVFNSLNEYLSTDITAKPKESNVLQVNENKHQDFARKNSYENKIPFKNLELYNSPQKSVNDVSYSLDGDRNLSDDTNLEAGRKHCDKNQVNFESNEVPATFHRDLDETTNLYDSLLTERPKNFTYNPINTAAEVGVDITQNKSTNHSLSLTQNIDERNISETDRNSPDYSEEFQLRNSINLRSHANSKNDERDVVLLDNKALKLDENSDFNCEKDTYGQSHLEASQLYPNKFEIYGGSDELAPKDFGQNDDCRREGLEEHPPSIEENLQPTEDNYQITKSTTQFLEESNHTLDGIVDLNAEGCDNQIREESEESCKFDKNSPETIEETFENVKENYSLLEEASDNINLVLEVKGSEQNTKINQHSFSEVFSDSNNLLNSDQKEISTTSTEEKSEKGNLSSDNIQQISEESTADIKQSMPCSTFNEEALTVKSEGATTVTKEDCIEEEIKPSQQIGFDDTFDLDESELNRYLDELEKEMEVPILEAQKEEKPSEEKPSESTAVQIKNIQPILKEETIEPQNLQVRFDGSISLHKDIKGQDISTRRKNQENVAYDEELNPFNADICEEDLQNEASEINCIQKQEFSTKERLGGEMVKCEESNIKILQSTGKKIDTKIDKTEQLVFESEKSSSKMDENTVLDDFNNDQVLSDIFSKSVDLSENVVSEDFTSNSNSDELGTSGRPKTLDISFDSSTDSKREINLVGDPGSTPYNNIYITKELPHDEASKMNQTDSDSTSSVSPTFSNASTESARSASSASSTTSSELNDVENNDLKQRSNMACKPKEIVCNSGAPVCSSNDSGKENPGRNLDNFESAAEDSPNNNSHGSGSKKSQENKDGNECDQEENYEVNETISVETSGDNVSNITVDVCPPSNNDNIPSLGDGDAANIIDTAQRRVNQNSAESSLIGVSWLGKQAPLWIPDNEAVSCLHCDMRFTVIKRRHHCRACGLVLCSKCCNLKYRLEYLDAEARVCFKCFDILNKDNSSGSETSSLPGNSPTHRPDSSQPNPNNPMEYCSVLPPSQQVANVSQNPPTVMVPVGVLKRKGSSKGKSNKSVMFCDGIRPGSDLTNLDNDFNYSDSKLSGTSSRKSAGSGHSSHPPTSVGKPNKNFPAFDSLTRSFIPTSELSLPPTVTIFKSDITYTECANSSNVVEMLKNETLVFALQRNLYVHVRIINMNCCINKIAWCFTTEGLINVGQDEVVFVLELEDSEKVVPKDVFLHINNIYSDAVKGTTVTELGVSLHSTSNFLLSKNHAGFLYIRPTFQCLQNVIVPKEPYLIGILIHRWETPWAKIFPLRLVLRLGAEYRYYPSPIISTRNRESVFVEIGHTIIKLLADFRNFSYTIPNIRGLTIHMEDKNTTVTIPVNRYDQVMKSLNNSSEHILAFGGNFSTKADSHLVCIQDTQGSNENAYTTHAINIQNKPRKVTGASFIVFNGALKTTSGLTAKSSIVEDGLMIQILAENMLHLRESLRNMKNYTIQCGCVNAASDETVNIVWGEADVNFNLSVTSPIDKQSLSGVPSIRVHNGKDFVCNSGNRLIRWTEVFILQNGDENARTQQDPIDISKLAESISKATCTALVKYLDLLASNNFYKIGIRTTLHVENVSYCAGSNGVKLPPIYMRSLDNELVPVLHRITSNNLGENAIVLELIFRILNV